MRTRPWEVDDALRERVQPLIPPAPSRSKGGRPRVDDRKVFAAMLSAASIHNSRRSGCRGNRQNPACCAPSGWISENLRPLLMTRRRLSTRCSARCNRSWPGTRPTTTSSRR